MEKEKIIARIKEYYCGALDRAFDEEEMFDIMPGVFIAPNETDDWTDRGALVFTKDENGDTDDCDEYSIEGFINDFSDLMLDGDRVLNEIAKLIYNDWIA